MSESSKGRESLDDSPQNSPSYRSYHSDESYEQRRARKLSKIEQPDRISALPDPLILQILSSLPMKEVIRTGVLAKRWHLLWTSAHNLIFRSSNIANHAVREFITSVDETLLLSKPSKLNKFSVEFHYNSKCVKSVNNWMVFVKNKSVEELDLYLRTRGAHEYYCLPQIMYSNACLRELSLCNSNLVPKEGINWPALKVLVIRYAKLSRDIVGLICSGCPTLESLKFSMCCGVSYFVISSKSVKKLAINGYWHRVPQDSDDDDDDDGGDDDDTQLIIYASNVTSVEITGCFHKKIPVLHSVDALVHAKLDFHRKTNNYGNDFNTDMKMLKDLLDSLECVEKLSIGSWCLQVLTMLETENSPCPRMGCKYLTLNTPLNQSEVPGLAILLQSCPQVEILNISNESPFEEYKFGWHINDFDGENYWISTSCWVLHLKTLRIVGAWIYESQYFKHFFPFLQAVLKNGIVLEKIILPSFDDDGTWISPEHHRRVTETLLGFPRSSRDAVILFSG